MYFYIIYMCVFKYYNIYIYISLSLFVYMHIHVARVITFNRYFCVDSMTLPGREGTVSSDQGPRSKRPGTKIANWRITSLNIGKSTINGGKIVVKPTIINYKWW